MSYHNINILIGFSVDDSEDSPTEAASEPAASPSSQQVASHSVPQTTTSEPFDMATNKVLATPAVRRMAGEMKVLLGLFPFTGLRSVKR